MVCPFVEMTVEMTVEVWVARDLRGLLQRLAFRAA